MTDPPEEPGGAGVDRRSDGSTTPGVPEMPDWRSCSAALHKVGDLLDEFAAADAGRPVLDPRPASELLRGLPSTMPDSGACITAVYDQLKPLVQGQARRNSHPGFWAYICGPGLPTDAAAHAWGAGLNQIVTSQGSAPGAVVLERRFIAWMCRRVGWDGDAGGLMVSGGSMGNWSALNVALHRRPEDLACNELGWSSIPESRWPLVYASEHAHFSVARAMSMLGLGRSRLRSIEADAQHRMDVRALSAAIVRDRAQQRGRPSCVVATAGTTACGAVDPVAELAQICSVEGLHLHVDAAYGGSLIFSDRLRGRLAGIEHADSLVIDLHKWGLTAIDASVLLYRDPRSARRAFAVDSDYAAIGDAASDEEFAFFHHGPETTRRARALPMVVALMHYGRERFAAWLEYCVDLCELLRALVHADPGLAEVAAGGLSIVCFRVDAGYYGWDDAQSDARHRAIVAQCRAEGRFLLSDCRIGGRAVLRVCIVNPHCRPDDLRGFVARVGELASSDDAR